MDRRSFLRHGTSLAGTAIVGRSPSRRADIVLHGGLVYDGTANPPARLDVVVRGDRVAAVERAGGSGSGLERVDVTGLAVAPGFIDIHSHTDLVLLVNRRAESKIRQGVTTEVVGQDGGSIGPWTDDRYQETRDAYRSRYDVDVSFRDLAGFFATLGRTPPSVNLASMIGAGTIRGYVVGEADRPATADEMRRMVEAVERALAAGACGLSSGLEYIPGAFATLDELIALARPLSTRGLPYASHLRNEDDQVLGAVEEALNVGRRAAVPVQIAHLKAQGRRNWWKGQPVLEVLEQARRDGIDVTFDRYPYVAYSTGLASLFPLWSREGGTAAFLARLRDPVQLARMKGEVGEKVAQLGSWNAVQITSTSSEALQWARGQRVGSLAQARGEDPFRLVARILIEDANRVGMVGFGMSEENTARFLRHPLAMICSDAGARAPYGALASGSPHPRAYGTFPRVLGHYCRDERLMPLELAIHKMTGMPAARLRLGGRGRITPGAAADLVIFDPATVEDRATFDRPHQYPTGIPHVLVNGVFVVRDGEHTGATPGRVVRPVPVGR